MEQPNSFDINYRLAPPPLAEDFKISRRFQLAIIDNFILAPTPFAEDFKINRRFQLDIINNFRFHSMI